MKRDIHVEVVYPYPPESVWYALTDRDRIRDWLMENDFKPIVGHRFRFHTKPSPGFDGIVNCEVLKVDRPHLLSYTWVGGGIDTVVTFTLDPVAEGTRLVLEHTGFQGMRAVGISYLLGSGWNSKILREALPRVLAQLSK
jgi:uncharacterized protein YndB with AHSA1/START domain